MPVNAAYTSASFGAPYQYGQPRFRYPIPQTPSANLVDMTYECAIASYPIRSLDYLDPGLVASYPTISYFLVYRQDEIWRDGELMRYVDTYGNLPPDHDEFESYNYTFPNYIGENTGSYLIRQTWAKNIKSRVHYTYYHGTNPNADITITPAFQPIATVFSGSATFIGVPVNYVQDAFSSNTGTTPSMSGYIASYVNSGVEIVAEATQFHRLYGNIYEIWTRYVIAQ